MGELYEGDWYCSVNIGIDEVRAMLIQYLQETKRTSKMLHYYLQD